MTGVEGADRGLPVGLGLLVLKTVWRVQWWGSGPCGKGTLMLPAFAAALHVGGAEHLAGSHS